MATPTNYWTSYGVKWPGQAGAGNAEDVQDKITMIDPDDAPMVAILPKTTTAGLLHEWLTDALAATSTAGASEGDAHSAASLTGRTRYQNAVQRFRKDIAVSNDQIQLSQRGGTFGVTDEYRYQGGKSGQEILRNIDARIVANTTAVASATGTTGVTSLMAAIRAYPVVATNVSGAFATATFLNLHETMFSAGAKVDTAAVSPGVKVDISRTLLNDGGLARVAQQQQLSAAEYLSVIDIIQTDFGRVAVMTDRWIPQASATAAASADAPAYFLFEKAKLALAYWRPLRMYDLAPQGDAAIGFMLAACTLEVRHPSCVGVGYNTIT